MSGGSYDYYYCKNAEEGIFESLGQLKQMIDDFKDNKDLTIQTAVKEIENHYLFLSSVQRSVNLRQDRLAMLLKAFEYTSDCNYSESRIINAMNDLLGLKE